MKKYKLFLIIKNNSERVNKKNFRLISGKPLHQYFLDQRKNFDIYIDTDSQEIFDFYYENKNYQNVKVYMRLQEHIVMENYGDISPAPYMIERFLKEFVTDEDEPIVTSHITSPFIEDSTILNAISLSGDFSSISSVKSVKEFCVKNIENKGVPINFPLDKIMKTQSLEPVGILNGAFFIFNKKTFLNNGLKRISSNHYYYPVSDIEALDIDTEFDLMLAKIYAERIV